MHGFLGEVVVITPSDVDAAVIRCKLDEVPEVFGSDDLWGFAWHFPGSGASCKPRRHLSPRLPQSFTDSHSQLQRLSSRNDKEIIVAS